MALVGFSGGAAFAGGLVLSDPERFAGAAVLHGTLPFDAGVPVAADRLAGTPLFVAHGDMDAVISRPTSSAGRGASSTVSPAPHGRRDRGGHTLTGETVAELADWLGELIHPTTAR